jgi:hypothetical protein
MQEQNPGTVQVPADLRPIIQEILDAHREKRIKTISFNNPTIWQIIDEPEPESKKIYIQIIPKESA